MKEVKVKNIIVLVVYAREALLHNDSAALFGSVFSVFHSPSLHKKTQR